MYQSPGALVLAMTHTSHPDMFHAVLRLALRGPPLGERGSRGVQLPIPPRKPIWKAPGGKALRRLEHTRIVVEALGSDSCFRVNVSSFHEPLREVFVPLRALALCGAARGAYAC